MFDWRNSKARLIVISDLEESLLPLHDKEMSAKVAWNRVYMRLAEFTNVPFAMFEARLKDHRKQVKARLATSLAEEQALVHDRQLYPRQTHNHRGEPVFDLSPAKECLREDVKNKLHTTMSSSELQATRPEYQGFKPSIFKDRIPQEVRRQKYLHYLEKQRSKKFDDRKQQRRKDSKSTAKKNVCAMVNDAMDEFDEDAMDES